MSHHGVAPRCEATRRSRAVCVLGHLQEPGTHTEERLHLWAGFPKLLEFKILASSQGYVIHVYYVTL